VTADGKQLEPLACPFVVLVDQQEKLPYQFTGLRADAREGRRPLAVTVKRGHLVTGDYSLEIDGRSYADRIAVERKSLEDAFGTLGQYRERFEHELARLQRLDFAAVVVEAEWDTIIRAPPERSQLRPKVVYRSILAWMQRYPKVHWVMCPGRQFAEVTTFRVLERWWKDNVRRRQTMNSPPMADDVLSAIEQRARAATPGPWSWYRETDAGAGYDGPDLVATHGPGRFGPLDDDQWAYLVSVAYGENIPGEDDTPVILRHPTERTEDATFLACAREDIPRLINEVRRLRAQLKTLEAR
jgi:hypothetical protein